MIRVLITAAVAVSATFAQAEPLHEPISFADKQIKLLIGFSPIAFGYDTYARMLGRYLGKHLPGHPVVVAQNRPGAGSLSLANYLYHAAPKDGTEIAMIGRGLAMDPLISGSTTQSKFDPRKFVWLGSMNNDVSVFLIRQPGPAKNLDDILNGVSLKLGSAGPGGDQQIFVATLNALLGTRLKAVGGYPGSNEIVLSVMRGELDGVVGYSWGAAYAGHKGAIDSGQLKVVMQLGTEKHPGLPNVPSLFELVTKPSDRHVLELIFARQAMGRPVVAPPGIDPRIATALRRGFADAMHDPQFVAESNRIGLEMNFVSGHDVQALVGRLYESPPDIVKRVQLIYSTY